MKVILLATLLTMSLHTIEEYISKLWEYDPFIIWLAQSLNVSSISIYLAIQTLALLLIAILLILALMKRFNIILGVVLGLIFILELLHPYNSIVVSGYYSGLYTGVVLIVIGIFYWKELIFHTTSINLD
jgi:lysylphosphatidylglycerol synthetase-like protein (DUF2156 family)